MSTWVLVNHFPKLTYKQNLFLSDAKRLLVTIGRHLRSVTITLNEGERDTICSHVRIAETISVLRYVANCCVVVVLNWICAFNNVSFKT